MKKFLTRRVDELQPGDVIVMAHALHITVASVRVVGNMAIMRDTRQAVYPWAASYVCHVLNPEHPHYRKNRLK